MDRILARTHECYRRFAALVAGAVLLGAVIAVPATARPLIDDRPIGGLLPESYAAKYAPEFRFDKDETWWPLSINEFIENSSLLFASRTCPDQVIASRGNVTKRRLGGAGGDPVPDNVYRARKRKKLTGGCGLTGRKFAASEMTRPFQDAPSRPHDLPESAGFYLDLRQEDRGGSKPSDARTPLYYMIGYEPTHGYYIRYFVMYGCSALATTGGRNACWHEGEWEGMSVLLGPKPEQNPPSVVFYNQHHNGAKAERWYNVPRSDWGVGGRTHPIIYVADGTHASYNYPGDQRTCYRGDDGRRIDPCRGEDVFDGRGPDWRPRKLVDVTEQSWFHYGGAWGSAGLNGDRTGPLGPGHPIRNNGFPSPWAFQSPKFPSGYGNLCIRNWYPGNCFREKDEDSDFLDLDCRHVPQRGFPLQSFRVDPHRFDGDDDNIGCEKSGNRANGAVVFEDETAGETGDSEEIGDDYSSDEPAPGDDGGMGEPGGGGDPGGGGASPPADSDHDGYPDSSDACPTLAGVAPNGCPATGPAPPDPDGDRDGVPDRFDSCPTVPGVSPGGCPPPPTCPSATVGARKGQTHRRRLPETGTATRYEATFSSFGRATYKFSVEPTEPYWNITIPANNATGQRLTFRYKAYNGPTPCPSEGTITIVVQ